jgi:hypothetical protein
MFKKSKVLSLTLIALFSTAAVARRVQELYLAGDKGQSEEFFLGETHVTL